MARDDVDTTSVCDLRNVGEEDLGLPHLCDVLLAACVTVAGEDTPNIDVGLISISERPAGIAQKKQYLMNTYDIM